MLGRNFWNCLTIEDHSPKKPGWFLAFLVFLALALRLSLYRYHHIIEGDGVHYAALARLISHDGNFLGAANEYWSNLWPLVIAFFDALFHNIELAGRSASSLFGSLTVIPVYLISREFLNKRTSLVAASLVVAQPYLLRFSVLMYTESFYSFLFALTLWLGIRLVKSPTQRERWFWLGLVIGLGLWTRPEILALAFLFFLVSLVRSFSSRFSMKKALIGSLVFAGVLLSFLSLRAVLIHHYQGRWHFGFQEKTTINIKMGLVFYSDQERYLNKFENGRFVNLRPQQTSLLLFLWKNQAEVLNRIKDNAGRIFQSYSRVIAPTKGVPLLRLIGMGLAFLGVLGTLFTKKTRGSSLLLILSFMVYSFSWLLIFVLDRFVLPLAIISVVFTAAGLIVLESGIASLFKRRQLGAWPILSFVIVVVFIMRTATWARHDRNFIWENDPVVQKEAGLFLKKHFPQQTKILTAGPHIPYYFYEGNPYIRSFQNIPWAPYEEVIKYVREKKLHLLVLPEWVLLAPDFPLKDLASPGVRPEGLEFVKVIGQKRPERVWIYKIKKTF
jgi:4-amino-4-deoxy-L-arabinose transferase-like glycosyltransferase